jgi:asparagine synthase (glutamine-hydrolysing)
VAVSREQALAKLSPLARRVLEENLTYLAPRKLLRIERCLTRIERDSVPGCLVETGVALGGSGIVIASHARGRAFHGYDVFGMIPPPGPNDPPEVHERYRVISSGESRGIGGETYYGYRDDLYDEVAAAFAAHGLEIDGRARSLHRGLFEDTLSLDEPVALVHIDCDWYEPVMLCLERLYPLLSVGGFIVADDYFDWEGARRACDEFLAAHADLERVTERGHLIVRRI